MHFPYRLSFIILLAVTLLCSVDDARAADEVRLPSETAGAPGQIVRILVTGTISANGTASVTLEYPHQIVSIRSITGSGLFAFRCAPPLIVENTPIDADRSRLVVECTDVVPMTNGTIFAIDVEFRQGAEALGLVVPTLLRINGADDTDAVLTGGVVKRTGAGIIQNPDAEGITSIYPNPVKSSATIAFVMRSAGIAHLQVRDSRGRLVQVLEDVSASAGQNVVDLGLKTWELGSGTYILQLTTDGGSFLYSFVVMK